MLIDGKSFFDLPVKNKEAYETIMSISKNNDYTQLVIYWITNTFQSIMN